MVFQVLHQHDLKVKRSKCMFAQQQLKYLGHIISREGVATDPKNVLAVQNWSIPSNVRQIREFLGLAGYYRKFIRNYGVISQPLTDLLKKRVVFVWTEAHTAAFQAIKTSLVTAPVLALPNFQKAFVIETDASKYGIGAVLMQDGHPLAFMSKSLGPRNRGLSTYEKECLAILMAVDRWRSYLMQTEFVIRTDQQSLAHLNDQRLSTPWQHKALTKMLGLQYRIEYKKGCFNRAADALSRREDAAEILAISQGVPVWLEDVKQGYLADPPTSKLLEQLATATVPEGAFQLRDGLIRYKGRLWLGGNIQMQQKILEALHTGALGGHSGISVTYSRISRLFAWPNLKKDVQIFIERCSICKQAKSEHTKYPGLLQPLDVPDQAWQVVTLDFVEGLPRSGGYNCILVVVDKLTRYAHFLPLAHPFTSFQVAKAYLDNVFKLHGLPVALVSDRDKVFTSQLWKELFKLSHTQLRMSSAYHPQTDGQTERVNQCMEAFLRCFVATCPTKWIQWLSLAEFWYNTSYHSALGKTPFEALYNHPPRYFGIQDSSCAMGDLA